MQNLSEYWHAVAQSLARMAAEPMPMELMIGLRILLLVACVVVITAQRRAWAGRWNLCRTLTLVSYVLIGMGSFVGALLAAQGGNNIKAYQVLTLLGILIRLVPDAISAGHRRKVRRRREGRVTRAQLNQEGKDER